MIEKRKLGRNGPEITTVGLGAWAIGGPWVYGWGVQDDSESIQAIRKSLELGVNWIDTAAIYGYGHSEEVVCKALEGMRREEIIIATKCGLIPQETTPPVNDLSPASIRREVEASLRRLGTDYIDLYQFHWPDNRTQTPVEDSWAAMADLQKEGKVRWIGVSNFDVQLLQRCEAVCHVDSLQPPYSLLRREVEKEILPWCLDHGVGVIVYSPMQAGLLSGSFDPSRVAEDDWRKRNPMFSGERLQKNLEFVDRLRPIAEKHGKTVGHLAIAWTLSNPAVTAAIVGARRASQAEENVQAMGWKLTKEELQAIENAFSD